MVRRFVLVGMGLILASGCASPGMRGVASDTPPLPAAIAFMTDFSTVDDAVAQCKAVMLGVEPRLTIVDITHQVTPFSIRDGARFLFNTAPWFPKGTVFDVVIDPGVGTPRKAMVAKSKRGHYYVLPDNGLITLVADKDGLEGAREITNPAWMLQSKASSTFHGRDIFAPVAAHLARGEDWTQVGPEIASPVRLEEPKAVMGKSGLEATAVALDGQYGNVITNVTPEVFKELGYALGDVVAVKLGKKTVKVTYAKTFGNVAEGAPLLYHDSQGRIALAVNMGNFAEKYGVKVPAPVLIPRKKK